MDLTSVNILGVLSRYFGFQKFREGQEEIISSILDGRDCVGVLPTGAGKSLCFQLPAVMRQGLTLVVSPLIALMKDQVDGLVAKGIPATFINSSLDYNEMNERLSRTANGEYRLVYVAPERFQNSRFLFALKSVELDLFVVDEAHCISMWGHDFRPDYQKLGHILSILGNPQVIALTATATDEVRKDIALQLRLGVPPRKKHLSQIHGFYRPELFLAVRSVRSHAEKLHRVLAILREYPTGIVYCSTRKNVEKVARLLRESRIATVMYHGGLEDEERRQAQERFISGDVQVAVATNAFGMGIDRSDLRAIVHWDIPGSLEAYYQEAGRAGRDGKPAHCELLYSFADVRTQEFFIDAAADTNRPIEEIEKKAKKDRARLKQLITYANDRVTCRHLKIIKYFGDPELVEGCISCDTCARRAGASRRLNRKPNEEEWTAIQKTLSCVARLNGKFGKIRISQVLAGSRDRAVLDLRLDKTSTYGLLSGFTLGHLRDMIDALIDGECIEIVGDEYPTLAITSLGRQVMNRQTEISLPVWDKAEKKLAPKQKSKPSKVISAEVNDPASKRLVKALVEMRAALAKKRGIPPYLILHNTTIEEIAETAPSDLDSLANVSGIGPAKLSAFGKKILEIVRGEK